METCSNYTLAVLSPLACLSFPFPPPPHSQTHTPTPLQPSICKYCSLCTSWHAEVRNDKNQPVQEGTVEEGKDRRGGGVAAMWQRWLGVGVGEEGWGPGNCPLGGAVNIGLTSVSLCHLPVTEWALFLSLSLSTRADLVLWARPFVPSLVIVQELCESRGGRPGLSVLTSLLVSVDVNLY